MNESCEICRRIEAMPADNPYLIADMETGYAVLGDNQQIPGYTIFLSKTCAPELHELPPAVRSRFLEEMALVAEATFRAFAPRKLNYELLGNSVSHLHWHLFPRYTEDPNPTWPVWNNEAWMNAPKRTQLDPAELAAMRDRARAALDALRRT